MLSSVDRLGVQPSRVLLYFEPDQRSGFPFDRHRPGGLVPMRRGEPVFFNTVIAAVDTGDGWRVVQTPPRPMIGAWERRAMLWFAVSVLALLPFAWFFARRLTRPIRSFAQAADRLGGDPLAPAVPVEGPAEPVPVARRAAEAAHPRRVERRVGDADALALGDRLALLGPLEIARLHQRHLEAPAREAAGEADAGGAGADHADVEWPGEGGAPLGGVGVVEHGGLD